MSLDGVYEYAESPNNPPPTAKAHRREMAWSNLNPNLIDLSLGGTDATAALWSPKPFTNPQLSENSFDATHHKVSIHTAQLTGHQNRYGQPSVFDSSFTQEQTWGNRRAVLIEAAPRDRQENARPNPETYKCQWKGCQYTGTFGRKADLMRHVETRHVCPKAYKCSFPGCSKGQQER
ncbi:hypothetical protein N7507_010192 [Penicillium longicatenatum]|nr:hypothetical protein N7507_010192 [Penicillium longicatenatum]